MLRVLKFLILFTISLVAGHLSDVVFIVLSQPNPYHAGRARELQIHFMEQTKFLPDDEPAIYLTHRQWQGTAAWIIFPLLEKWVKMFPGKSWMFVCEEETRINLTRIDSMLQRYDPSEDWFLGHALRDKEPTIIHHFADPNKLTFPDFAAGFLLSFPLLKKLADRWPDPDFRADFAIDPKHEFASFVLLSGVTLTNVPELCGHKHRDNCATTISMKFPYCGPPVKQEDLFVAVKTCEKFHTDRVPVVLKTWAQETDNLEFYSETEDKSIPTIDLGVPNTERGHCGKTMAIMKRAVTEDHIRNTKWLLVADDDTIINIEGLQRLLACYDPDSLVALGERYGYQTYNRGGYDYITGGGGMIFSMPVVQRLVDECRCPGNDSPDDMILGMCLKRMEIPITHVPYIHQARPADYSAGYLGRQIPISFHKHWNCDPYQVYKMLKGYSKDLENLQSKGSNDGQTVPGDKRDEL